MQGGPVARPDSGTHRAATLVPPAWRVIIDKAMAAAPGDRYPDARALSSALRGLEREIPNEASS
jgi:hypothetical protein